MFATFVRKFMFAGDPIGAHLTQRGRPQRFVAVGTGLWLGAVTAIFAVPSAASAEGPPALTLRLGVPVLLSFYGFDGDDGHASRDYFGRGVADLSWDMGKLVRVGGIVEGNVVVGDFRGADGHLYAIAVGPIAQLHSKRWSGDRLDFGVGISPRALVYGASAGEDRSKNSTALGVDAELGIRMRATRQISVALFGGLALYSAPLGDDQWSDERLGSTSIGHIDLGVVWQY